MHALYCRILHLHHDHGEPSAAAQQPPQELAPQMSPPLTRPSAATAPRPRERHDATLDAEHRPSLHTLIVPRLVEAGYTLDQIGSLTGMPRALVELIADEHGPGAASSDAAQQIRDFLQAKLREAELARRRRTRIVAAIVLMALVNIAASLASIIWRIPALGAVATVGSFLLVLAAFVLARRTRPRRTERPNPHQ